jgi:hypothetical protein
LELENALAVEDCCKNLAIENSYSADGRACYIGASIPIVNAKVMSLAPLISLDASVDDVLHIFTAGAGVSMP